MPELYACCACCVDDPNHELPPNEHSVPCVHCQTPAKADLDALAERLAEVTAERDALSEGRCLADITHRDEEHRQSVCMLPKDHAPLMHDDCMGCTWTDAEHWKASAVDRVANAVASHPDPTCDEYASKGPISCGWKRALIDVRWALADGSGS